MSAASPQGQSPPDRRARVAVLLALLFAFSYFNHSDGWNQGVRLAELHAMVLKGTLRIDDYVSYTGDRALIDGHYYSEKAPAMAVAALPAFAVTVGVQKMMGIDPDSVPATRWSEWIATALSVGLLAAIGGTAFFELVRVKADALTAVISTFGIFLGTLVFPYATALFSHAGTIGLLTIALWAVLASDWPRRDAIAGLAAGFAVASEYPAALPCAAIGLYLWAQDWRRMIRFCVATAPAAALILANNYAISGSPFKLSYGSNPLFPELTATTNFGFNMPDIRAMWAVLWGEYRGLFFWCPVLLMSVPGFVVMFRKQRAQSVMAAGACALILLQVASFYSWFGGNAFGPRYLAPAIPFLGLAAAYGIHRFPEMGLILTLVSMLLMLMVTAIAIDPPGDVLTPLQSFYLVRVQQGRWAQNLGTVLGLPLWASLMVPLIVPACAAWHIARESRAAA